MNASPLPFVVVAAVLSTALLSTEARPEGHFGIQYNQQTGRHECPLVLMLPFTDVRAGPPEWAKHSIIALPEEGSVIVTGARAMVIQITIIVASLALTLLLRRQLCQIQNTTVSVAGQMRSRCKKLRSIGWHLLCWP